MPDDAVEIEAPTEVVRYREATADPMLTMLERVVANPSADVEKLERLYELWQRAEDKKLDRERESAFTEAFASAAAEFPPIPLNGTGHNNKPYAMLKDIIGLTRPVLSKYGLTLSFATEVLEKSVKVTAYLSHRAGYSRSTSMPLPLDASGSKNPVQAVGSSQTYGMRYTAQAILGLSLGDDTDDDGKGAGTASAITDDQEMTLRDMISESGANEARFLAHFRIERLADLPAAKYGDADAMLRAKLKAARA